MQNVKGFRITTVSNLHVGSGEQNFGIVDNLVQKDAVTQIPNINSSSLKGAIKDHFMSNDSEWTNGLKRAFGDETSAGEIKFLEASLLALPTRSNTQIYFLATTKGILESYVNNQEVFMKQTISLDIPTIEPRSETVLISANDNNSYVEDFKAKYETKLEAISKALFDGKPLALFSDEVFKTLSLPIVTRNKIAKHEEDDNNLFYEEVVPRNTIFYTYMINPSETHMNDIDKDDIQKGLNNIYTTLQNDIVQIGANASIGYGMCKFEEIK